MTVMSNELPSIFLNKCFEAQALLSTDDAAEYLVHAIRKIGFIAACIDLDSWRRVIDQVVSEVESENENAEFFEDGVRSLSAANPAGDQHPGASRHFWHQRNIGR